METNWSKSRRTKFGAVAGLAVWLTGVTASAAWAQTSESRWGVSASLMPSWKANGTLQSLLLASGEGRFEGKEFSIGVVRGRTNGGEWGVSFVRKPFKNGVAVTDREEGNEPNFSYVSIETATPRGVYVRGVEFHAAMTFVTIRQRVQIGMLFAGGVGSPEGIVEQKYEYTSRSSFQAFDPVARQTVTRTVVENQNETLQTPANEAFFKRQPLGKAEVQVAVIVAPGLKIRVSGGPNTPGTGVRVNGVYLFGG